MRGARSAGGPQGARRGRRQRHGRASPRRGAGATWSRPTTYRALLERGRARASAEGLAIEFKEADAEALPFGDSSFDTVVSTFGVMFTPNQDQAAAELLRVCKSGGQIGLANWTPDGFIGQMFKTLGKYLPPPAAAKSPLLWGTRARLTEMFGAGSDLDQDRVATFQFPLSLGGALRRCVQDLLRSDAQGILLLSICRSRPSLRRTCTNSSRA